MAGRKWNKLLWWLLLPLLFLAAFVIDAAAAAIGAAIAVRAKLRGKRCHPTKRTD